ncbi:hypothetical protein V5799_034459 [Amblyomma americanum]|uniref:Uncharacterized protein n=1 Tax=Amblyomma americanum TaxID=6943 RepID=A0AAQ4DKE3_AMBAM
MSFRQIFGRWVAALNAAHRAQSVMLRSVAGTAGAISAPVHRCQPSRQPALLQRTWTGMSVIRRIFNEASCKLCLLLIALAWQQVLACDSKLPPLGPRLFRAKALFGEAMKHCHGEFAAAAREFPSEKFRKFLHAFCQMLNVCKETIPEKTTELMNVCVQTHTKNRTGILYSEVGLSYSLGEKIQKIWNCFHEKNMTSVPYEVTLDATTVGYFAALNFGWT